MQGWTTNTTGTTGGVSFVTGPGFPARGGGSVQLSIGTNASDFAEVRNPGMANLPLSSLTTLTYATYVASPNTSSASSASSVSSLSSSAAGASLSSASSAVSSAASSASSLSSSSSSAAARLQAPMLVLDIDNDGNGTVDDMLFFEPQYQNGTAPALTGVTIANQCGATAAVSSSGLSSSSRSSAASVSSALSSSSSAAGTPSACVQMDAWQTWNARTGGWWSLTENVNGPPLTTLDNYVSRHPLAKIVNSSTGQGGVRIGAGGSAGWQNFSGNADNLVIAFDARALTTYDFESDASASSAASSSSTSSAAATTTTTTGGGGGTTTNGQSAGGSRGQGGIAAPGFGGGTSVPGALPSTGSQSNGSFSDVPPGSYYEQAVNDFIRNGFLDTADSRFRPGDNALRSELAKLIVEMNGGVLHTPPATPSFDDVQAGAWYYQYFEDAGSRGWIHGDNNCYGSHPCTGRPGSTINRAEAAAMMIRMFNYEATTGAPKFTDVPGGAWYASVVQAAADHCILQGDAGSTRVRPAASMNRAEMIAMLWRAYKDMSYADGCQASGARASISSVRSLNPTTVQVTFTGDIAANPSGNQFIVSCNGLQTVSTVSTVDARTVDVTLGRAVPASSQCRLSVMRLPLSGGSTFNDSLVFTGGVSAQNSSSSRSSSSVSSARSSSVRSRDYSTIQSSSLSSASSSLSSAASSASSSSASSF